MKKDDSKKRSASAQRTRLSPQERERQIVEGAVTFFADVGFSGQTRELAKRLGITQGLLYRYFPSKELLLERVYQEVFEGRWNPFWEDILKDRTVPLKDRLVRFYTEYARMIHTYEWLRIFLLAGMANLDINERFRVMIKRRVYVPIIGELRQEFGLPPLKGENLTPMEEEMMFGLHGSIFFIGVRQWVYHYTMPVEVSAIIKQQITLLLEGAKGALGPDQPNGGKSRRETSQSKSATPNRSLSISVK